VRDQHPIRTARRKTLRKERLGSDDFCLFCGYACLESLTPVSRRWLEQRGIPKDRLNRLLELHHGVGEAHDPDVIIMLCLNCHREITEGLACEGVSMHPETNLLKVITYVLRASAALFESLATSYRKWASRLEDRLEKGQDES
jgi:hypothetical protein